MQNQIIVVLKQLQFSFAIGIETASKKPAGQALSLEAVHFFSYFFFPGTWTSNNVDEIDDLVGLNVQLDDVIMPFRYFFELLASHLW